jgi:hypothetical protein
VDFFNKASKSQEGIMNTRELKILFLLMIASVSMTVLACASNRVNLLKDGTYKLEPISSGGYYISNVHVNKVDDGLEITGKVKRRSYFGVGDGHVDIAIVSPEGEVFEKLSTFYVPRTIPMRRRHRSGAHFTLRLPVLPPNGSTVIIAHHSLSEPVNKTFSCGES